MGVGPGALLLALLAALLLVALAALGLSRRAGADPFFRGRYYKGLPYPPPFRYLDVYRERPEERGRHEKLYRLLALIAEGLEARRIPFWTMGGTTLGAVRHSGLIPWDDDADLGVWETDLPRVRQMVQEGLSQALEWGTELRSQTIALRGEPRELVDIFPMRRDGDGRVVFSNPLARDRWPKEYLTPAEFGSRRAFRPFGPLWLPTPARPCTYLDRVYPGWDWRGRIARHFQLADGSRRADEQTVVRFDPAASRAACGPSAATPPPAPPRHTGP